MFFLNWDETFRAGAEAGGGKGLHLSRLVKYGFRVPAGGVLSLDAYEEFLRENGLEDAVMAASSPAAAVEGANEEDARKALESLRQRIVEGAMPERVRQSLEDGLRALELFDAPVAVRSSAAAEDTPRASFAGIYESFLNVRGFEAVLTAIKGCYASLWTPGALSYRRKMGIAEIPPASAVVIMEMVNTVASGVGFTCNPRSGRRDELIVNAGYGLGDAVVSGRIDPDEYRLSSASPLRVVITSKKIGAKEGLTVAKEGGGTEFVAAAQTASRSAAPGPRKGQALQDESIVRLGGILMRIFDGPGRGDEHQDVEWAFDGSDFFILQARPVTTLPRYTYPALGSQPDMWSNANLRDAIPMVLSTLGWTAVKTLTEHMASAPFRAVGYPLLPGLEYVRRFRGRAYLNISLQQWEYYDAFGVTPAETNELIGGHQPEIDLGSAESAAAGRRWGRRVVRLYRKLRLYAAVRKARKEAKSRFAVRGNRVERWRKRDYGSLDNTQILEVLHEMNRSAMEFVHMVMLLNSDAGFSHSLLVHILSTIFPGKGNAMANALLIGRAGVTSAEHGERLMEMAWTARNDPDARAFFSSDPFAPGEWERALPETSAFKKEFRSFIDEFGHRGVDETDIANPRWREDPAFPLEVVRGLAGAADLREMMAGRKEAGERARRMVETESSRLLRALVRWWVRRTAESAGFRESGKSETVRMGEALRTVLNEVGGRLVDKGILDSAPDVYHCSWSELRSLLEGSWDGKGLDILVAERRERKAQLESISPSDLVVDEMPRYAGAAPSAGGKTLMGLGVAAGIASGRARLIRHPSEGGKLNPGEVLVAPSTDPAWTPLFLKASAVVMETGGFLSHGAIVAREYGVPAVVNVPGVMGKLEDGWMLIVDGDKGEVRVMEEE